MRITGRYDYSHALVLKDLITDDDAKELDLGVIWSRRGRRARAIFGDFLSIVVDDLIETGSKFISPNYDWMVLSIAQMDPRNKSRVLRNITKIYKDVDLIKSEGNIYEFRIFQKRILRRYRTVRISYKKYKKLIANVNEGKRYPSWRTTRMKDYMDRIKSIHPEVDELEIKMIVKFGFENIVRALIDEQEIKIRSHSLTNKIEFLIYSKRSLPKKDATSK